MNVISTNGDGEVLDPNEFLERVWSEYNEDDRETVLPLIEDFRKVANNTGVFLDKIHNEIKSYATKNLSQYAQASILFAGTRGKRPYLRANIWPPVDPTSPAANDICQAYSYNLPHNHNFSFLTTGYLGSEGYQTEVWTLKTDCQNLKVGDVVETEFEGEYRLDTSKVMFYEAHKDIHIQRPPKAYSLSLNLMLKADADKYTDQHFFEPKSGKVVGVYSQTLARRRMLLLYVASLIGSEETYDILLDIALKSPDERLRVAAKNVLQDRVAA